MREAFPDFIECFQQMCFKEPEMDLEAFIEMPK